MADFEIAFAKTIANEGGDKYTETKGDNGGATKYGISLKFLKTLKKLGTTRGNELLYPNSNEETIKNLSQGEAEYIYLNYFWEANLYGQINDQALADKVFDMAVLFGSCCANKALQFSLSGKIKIDGIIIGGITLSESNNLGSYEVMKGISLFICKHCVDICNKDKSQSKFLLGWLNRVMS